MTRDVIVLGAGPAGCAAAIRCAEAGLRALILERESFPRHRPGETLHPGAETALASLGVALGADLLRPAGVRVAWGSDSRFEPYGEQWRGFQANRAWLDSALLDRARALAVEVRMPCRVEKPIVEGGRVCGVIAGGEEHRARWLIDASGGAHWLARRLGVAVDSQLPRRIARYGYVSGVAPACADAPLIASDAEGWTWLAQVDPETVHWTRLSLLPRTPKRWRPPGLEGMPLIREGAADVTWRVASRAAGPGWLVAGDAAMVLDPLTGHGVLRALYTGAQAAQCVAAAARDASCEKGLFNAYSQSVRSWFDRECAVLRGLYDRVQAGRA